MRYGKDEVGTGAVAPDAESSDTPRRSAFKTPLLAMQGVSRLADPEQVPQGGGTL